MINHDLSKKGVRMIENFLNGFNCAMSGVMPTFQPGYPHQRAAELDRLATEAYVYGYPLVITDVTKRLMLADGARLNQFRHEREFPTPQYGTIVRPNVDTLYSMAWLDLADEPVLLHVPDTRQRYYLMELLDAWTNVFASLGTRTTGSAERIFAITGPQWNGKLPEGVLRVEAPTDTVWIIGRTQTDGPQDYPLVHAIQDQYVLMPLNCQGAADTPTQQSDGRSIQLNPADLVANMDAALFFQTMMLVMEKNPPWVTDPAIERKLAALDLTPDPAFDFARLYPPIQAALQRAVAATPRLMQVEAWESYCKLNVNGWTMLNRNMGFYGADYLRRAIVAMTGIGANLPQDAVYAPAFSSATGQPLTGTDNYWVHFQPETLPPVHAFWSLTLYNENGYLVQNPVQRYAIGPHLEPLTYNEDGSLDLYIGNRPPGTAILTNWLPAPAGLFNLMLRMYWPAEPILTGQWIPPAIREINADDY